MTDRLTIAFAQMTQSVGDLEALTYANFICNEDGFDPISFGATVGAVMELYQMGVLTDVVPAPDEPVIDMMGWLRDI